MKIEKQTSLGEALSLGVMVAQSESSNSISGSSSYIGLHGSGMIYCLSGDIIRLIGFQDSGANLDTNAGVCALVVARWT